MQRAGAALSGLMKELGMENALGLYRIKSEWQTLFDAPVGMHTSPVGLSGGVLTVNVDSPAWLHELSFLKAEVICKLAPLGVNDVRFRLGAVKDERKRR